MTISQLQKFLASAKRKHGDLEVAFEQYSDYRAMENNDNTDVAEPYDYSKPGGWCSDGPRVVVAGYVRGAAGEWFRREPPVDGEAHVEKATILLFPGN